MLETMEKLLLEKVKEYFEKEYISTVHAIERKYSWGTPREFEALLK